MSIAPDHADPSIADPSNSITSVVDAEAKSTISSVAHQYYSFAASGFLALLAIPLMLFPSVLSLIFGSLLTESARNPEISATGAQKEVIRTLNVLERSLAGLAGSACAALAALLLIQTGVLPLTSSLSSPSTVTHSTSDAPFRNPTIMVTTAFFSSLGWYSYDMGMWLVALPSAGLSIWGLWAIIFAHTGTVNQAGKSTSSFPFKNDHAEKEKKMKAL